MWYSTMDMGKQDVKMDMCVCGAAVWRLGCDRAEK